MKYLKILWDRHVFYYKLSLYSLRVCVCFKILVFNYKRTLFNKSLHLSKLIADHVGDGGALTGPVRAPCVPYRDRYRRGAVTCRAWPLKCPVLASLCLRFRYKLIDTNLVLRYVNELGYGPLLVYLDLMLSAQSIVSWHKALNISYIHQIHDLDLASFVSDWLVSIR